MGLLRNRLTGWPVALWEQMDDRLTDVPGTVKVRRRVLLEEGATRYVRSEPDLGM
jgi:hypothetical protein